jgi:signal transduction histidine kinase
MEERNRFFRYVSHEFRTPLTSVIGFTEYLIEDEDEPLTQNQKHQLLKVHSSAHRLLGMVDDLLDISKVEAGRMEVQKNEIDLDDMIEQIVDSERPLAAEKALDINIGVSDDLPDLVTDEQKLSQIILNLLSNAIKYTQEGTITINAFSGNDAVKISIRDTGIGIAEDELANIFKEFYRVQGGTVQRGTGLGLTIVKKFTELLGGSVTVESKLYAGSTFTVTLPVTLESHRKHEKAADPVVPVC